MEYYVCFFQERGKFNSFKKIWSDFLSQAVLQCCGICLEIIPRTKGLKNWILSKNNKILLFPHVQIWNDFLKVGSVKI